MDLRNEPGAKEDRIRWNKAGTRKWLTVYTVEYHPKSEAKAASRHPHGARKTRFRQGHGASGRQGYGARVVG